MCYYRFVMQKKMVALDSFVSEASALVRECLADGKLDASEILRIGVFAAQKVNALKALSGPEKKTLVLEVVKKAVEAVVPAERREQVGYTAALQVLPTVLDIAVAAAHGKLALRRVRERVSVGCLVGCFSGLWARRADPAAAAAAAALTLRETVLEPVAAPQAAPAAEPPVPKETPESASPPPAEPQATTEASPPKESPKEPSPQASAEAPRPEIRPPEVAGTEPPSSATPPESPVPSE